MGRRDKIMANIERSQPYIVPDVIRTTMDEMAQAAGVCLHMALTASFASGLVDIIKGSTKISWDLCVGWLRNAVRLFQIRERVYRL